MAEDLLARHLDRLNEIKKFLEELKFEVSVIEKNDQVPLSTLVTVAGKDSKEMPRILNLNLIPTSKEVVESIDLLQVVTFLNYDVVQESKNSVEKLLLAINSRTAVGDFFIDENNKIIFRYVYVSPMSSNFVKEVVIEMLMLFVYMVEIFDPIIGPVARGEKALGAALKELP